MDGPTPIVDAPSTPSPQFRRARIAVSVFFGMLTAALVVLWVRNMAWPPYSTWMPTSNCGITSSYGVMSVCYWTAAYNKNSPVNDTIWWADVNARKEGMRRHGVPMKAFFVYVSRDYYFVIVPYWFLVTATATVAVVTRWPNPLHRFSLRRLLIAMTLVAVVLGLAVLACR